MPSLVAELDGELVGTVIAAWDGWRGNMYRLTVRPDHRRTGIARLLAHAGEERLREKGAVRVTALVPRDDQAAAGLWSTAGYELDPFVDRFVKDL
jgi:ribosomal protein S18 acetylase RimI-like enzyme